jgi:hypothetical protein
MNKENMNVRTSLTALLLSCIAGLLVHACGYHIVGSRFLPFRSIAIKPVVNTTYEPKVEEKMHEALSTEFIHQGITIIPDSREAVLETTIRTFALGAIGAVDETVKEQEVLMSVDIHAVINGEVTEFKEMRSPIKITFQSTGTVSESAARKDDAVRKACREIAKEVVSKLIIVYGK